MSAKQQMRSLLPTELVESHFFEGGRVTCIKSRFVVHRTTRGDAKRNNKGGGDPFDAKYSARLYLAFWFHSSDPEVEIDSSKSSVEHSMGSLNYWRPSNDGYTPLVTDPDQLDQSWMNLDTEGERLASEGLYFCEVDDDGDPVFGSDGELLNPDYKSKRGVSTKSNLGEFIDWTCNDGDYPLELIREHTTKMGTSAKCWEGVEAIWEPVAQKKGDVNEATGKPWTIMVITSVVNTGIDVSNFAVDSVPSTSSAGSGQSDIEGFLEGKIAELLAGNGNSMTRGKILPKVGKFGIPEGDLAKSVGLMAADAGFLDSVDRPWTFDKESQVLTLTD